MTQLTIEGDLAGILESTELKVLASDAGGLEGPVWHPDGSLTYVDLPSSRLLRWSPAKGVETVRENTGEGNGCTLDRQGRLLMCEGGRRRITRREKDGSWTTLAERWRGKCLNRPNDIVVRSDGMIYFTDPILSVPKEAREQDGSVVWRLAPDGTLEVAARDCEFPNGLGFSPDEKILYVSNSFRDAHCFEERRLKAFCTHRDLAVFDVHPDGSLSNHRKFMDMSSDSHSVPDGLKVDRNGVIFCTGSGATWVIAPSGKLLGKIITPDLARNCAFGDADFKTLYITAITTLYSVRVKTPGIVAY